MPIGDHHRRERVELAVFLLLVVPAMLLAAAGGAACPTPFVLVASVNMLRDVALVALVVYFAWANGERPGALGITLRRAPADAAIGAGLFVGIWLVLVLLDTVAGSLALPKSLVPHSPIEIAVAVVLVVVVAIAEEVVFRGYLLLRLRQVTGNTRASIAIAALVFGAGHAYEGVGAVVVATLLGAIYAMVYLWRRSLVAPIVMHLLQDLFAVVLTAALR